MKNVCSIALILLTIPALAQQRWSFEYWHDGKAVLEAGDTLKGKIKYEIDKDLIELNQNGALLTLTSRKVVFYEIFDAIVGRYRQFYAIPYSTGGGYKVPVFFELLTEGKLTLLAKEALESRNTSTGYYGYGTVTRLVLVDKYFVLDEKGGVNPFSGKKAELLLLMKSREDEISKYLRSADISLSSKPDVVRVFAYYNALQKK